MNEELDPEETIKKILSIIVREIKKINEKSQNQSLDIQESKLLDSYLRSVLAADERLQLGQKKTTQKEIAEMTPEELKKLIEGTAK